MVGGVASPAHTCREQREFEFRLKEEKRNEGKCVCVNRESRSDPSPGLSWTQLDSAGLSRTQLDSAGLSRTQLTSEDFSSFVLKQEVADMVSSLTLKTSTCLKTNIHLLRKAENRRTDVRERKRVDN